MGIPPLKGVFDWSYRTLLQIIRQDTSGTPSLTGDIADVRQSLESLQISEAGIFPAGTETQVFRMLC